MLLQCREGNVSRSICLGSAKQNIQICTLHLPNILLAFQSLPMMKKRGRGESDTFSSVQAGEEDFTLRMLPFSQAIREGVKEREKGEGEATTQAALPPSLAPRGDVCN